MGRSVYSASGNSSGNVTTKTNVTGELTPILEISPENRGTFLRFLERITRGSERGIPIYAKLRSGANTQLPVDTQVALQVKLADEDHRRTISDPFDTIITYRENDFGTQQNVEHVDSVKHDLKEGNSVTIDDADTLYVSIDSSATISHSDSQIMFESDNVVRGSG